MPMNKKLTIAALIVAAAALGAYGWQQWRSAQASEGLISGNGRIEATEIDVATKYAGRIAEILVQEGEFVKAGQPLARMQIESLQAQQREAIAGRERASHAVTSARAEIALRESQYAATMATVAQREAELDAALRRVKRLRRWRAKVLHQSRSWTTTGRACVARRPHSRPPRHRPRQPRRPSTLPRPRP